MLKSKFLVFFASLAAAVLFTTPIHAQNAGGKSLVYEGTTVNKDVKYDRGTTRRCDDISSRIEISGDSVLYSNSKGRKGTGKLVPHPTNPHVRTFVIKRQSGANTEWEAEGSEENNQITGTYNLKQDTIRCGYEFSLQSQSSQASAQ